MDFSLEIGNLTSRAWRVENFALVSGRLEVGLVDFLHQETN